MKGKVGYMTAVLIKILHCHYVPLLEGFGMTAHAHNKVLKELK